MSIRAYTIFSEYGRADSNGSMDTLVGVFPAVVFLDPVQAAQGFAIPFFTFTKIEIDRDDPVPKLVKLQLTMNGDLIAENPIDQALLNSEFERVKSKEFDLPTAQFVSRISLMPLLVKSLPTELIVHVYCDSNEIIAGRMFFRAASRQNNFQAS